MKLFASHPHDCVHAGGGDGSWTYNKMCYILSFHSFPRHLNLLLQHFTMYRVSQRCTAVESMKVGENFV